MGQRTNEVSGRRLCPVAVFSAPDWLALELSAVSSHPPPPPHPREKPSHSKHSLQAL